MKADEAAELMDRDKETDQFKTRAAMVIAFFAMCLAITGLGGANAAKEAFNSNILASNYFAFFQAKNIRQTSYQLAADELELTALGNPALPAETRKAIQAKVDAYKKTVERYELEPDTREGKKELLRAGARARAASRPRAQAGSVFRLWRGAAADRHRAGLGRDRRQSAVAGVSRRRARTGRDAAEPQRLPVVGGGPRAFVTG